jgi:hypothetical protein
VRDKKTQERRRKVMERLIGQEIGPGQRFKMKDGYYRVRRGKIVRIPDEWVGRPEEFCGTNKKWRHFKYKVKHPRQSQEPKKLRRRSEWNSCWGRVPRERVDRNAYLGRDSYGNVVNPDRKLGHPNNRSPRHLRSRERRIRDAEDGLDPRS